MINKYGVIYYPNSEKVEECVFFKETEEEAKALAKELIDTHKTCVVKWFKVCGVVQTVPCVEYTE